MNGLEFNDIAKWLAKEMIAIAVIRKHRITPDELIGLLDNQPLPELHNRVSPHEVQLLLECGDNLGLVMEIAQDWAYAN